MSLFSSHVKDYDSVITEGLDEAGDAKSGTIIRRTQFPGDFQMIYSGPHIYVGNPLYKTPRSISIQKADYDVIDLTTIDSTFSVRTNYIPHIDLNLFRKRITGFSVGKDVLGNSLYDDWFDYYHVGARKMLNVEGERTLTPAILPPKTSHINGIISITFREQVPLLEFAGISQSIIMDFYLKTIGARNLSPIRIDSFPMGLGQKYLSPLFCRTLMLNCINEKYADLWQNNWSPNYKNELWSHKHPSLFHFESLSYKWNEYSFLRNYYERRLALVEIDVIVAQGLNLSLVDLEMIYTLQFPVLKQNEEDTWYDQKGNIVFTCSKGLVGVGVDRPVWESIRNQKEGETYTHTIDTAKSELYGGQQVTYYAPYTKCDRIEDYRRAWAHFEKVFKDKK